MKKKESKEIKEDINIKKELTKSIKTEISDTQKDQIKLCKCKTIKSKNEDKNSSHKKSSNKIEHFPTIENSHIKQKSTVNNNFNKSILIKKSNNNNKKGKEEKKKADNNDKELIPSMSCRNLLNQKMKENFKTETNQKQIFKKTKNYANQVKSKQKKNKNSNEYDQKPEIIFKYNGIETIIQVNLNDNMGKIIENFSNKINIDKKNIIILYNGDSIKENLTFNQQANEYDLKRSKMNVLVNDISDAIEEKKETIKSKECICPECYENVIISLYDYHIKYQCKNNHNKILLLRDYENIQKLELKKIICVDCKENTKFDTYDNVFYFCFNCNSNLCPLCEKNHKNKNPQHLIVNYDDKYYKCKKHNEQFIDYCKQCQENVCFLCQKEHKKHENLINLQNIMIEKEQLIKEFKDTEKLIEEIKTFVAELKNKFDDFINNLDIFYKINKNFINNYNIQKRNYESFHNIKEIKVNNDKLIKDLKSIIYVKNLNIKISNMMNLYNQINTKIEEKIYETGEKYVGELENNLRNGKGKFYFAKKDPQKRFNYEGEWKNDIFEGEGVMYFKNNDVYKGEWKNGKKEGKGIYIYNNGNIYDGEWKNDKKEGKGALTFNTSDKYEGQFKNDLIERNGIFYYKNGNKFIGEFRNNFKEGKGVLFHRNGDIEMSVYSKNVIVGKSFCLK